jgi:hypothetical protein
VLCVCVGGWGGAMAYALLTLMLEQEGVRWFSESKAYSVLITHAGQEALHEECPQKATEAQRERGRRVELRYSRALDEGAWGFQSALRRGGGAEWVTVATCAQTAEAALAAAIFSAFSSSFN